MIDYRLLGPLEVTVDGHALDVGGLKQRALLAILLLHANQPVPRDVLIDQLWGEHPPTGPDHAMDVYIWRLRKTLDPAAGNPCVLTRAGGYQLQAAPEQVDLARFEHLAQTGERSQISWGRRSLRRRSVGWRSCAPRLPNTGSRRIWRSASTPASSANWRPLLPPSRCVRGRTSS